MLSEKERPWRRAESYQAEVVTRAAVAACLRKHGFTDVIDKSRSNGSAIIQTVTAQSPMGEAMNMRVKLCWRLERGNGRARLYSAFQISATLVDNDWETTVRRQADRYKADGNTHVLAVQPGLTDIDFAAVIPCHQLDEIWRRQDVVGRQLIERGLAGKITKSPARNGRSPTLYLMDDRTRHTHAIADVLWSHDGVINVKALGSLTDADESQDDTLDDCPYSQIEIGRDQGTIVPQVRSGFSRDPKVRMAVLTRAAGRCERNGCGESRNFAGFLDVHHILGVARSDRLWTCVALCPNCHREAHFAPDADLINASLKEFAARWTS